MNKENIPILYKPWKIFAIEAFLFFITLLSGIITSFRLTQLPDFGKTNMPKVSLWYFISSFFIATLVILIIVRLIKFNKQKRIIFKLLFVLAIFSGGVLLLGAWIPGILPMLIMAFLIVWWFKKPSILIQDICIVLGIAGVGSVLGLTIAPETMVILLIVFSIYDFIAVFKTKHMVQMAKAMIESKAILGLVVPPDINSFKGTMGDVKPGGKFLVLGGGDIVFPLLLCSSLVATGILNSLIVAVFSLIGLFFSFLFFVKQKRRRAIPALPPIALFSIIGFLLTKLI
jgi:presenilin-like A22 family membrane protease